MSQLHQRPRSKLSLSDEFETPKELYKELCKKYKLNPRLDVACSYIDGYCNKKCYEGWFEGMDSLNIDWVPTGGLKVDVWCNPPHSLTERFVKKACEQWKKHNINVMMIIPANTMSSQYWEGFIEGFAEYHPIRGRIRFLVDGKPTKYHSRNAYVCVIFRKRLVPTN